MEQSSLKHKIKEKFRKYTERGRSGICVLLIPQIFSYVHVLAQSYFKVFIAYFSFFPRILHDSFHLSNHL